jgi:hypothetical protein
MQKEYKVLRRIKTISTIEYRVTLSDKRRDGECKLGIIAADNMSEARQYLMETLDASIRGYWVVSNKIEDRQ